MARLPWTALETKERLKEGYIADGKTAIQMLKDTGSTACSIYSKLRLTRKVIKSALKVLRYERLQKVTLTNVICATRFKFYKENRKFPAKCRVLPECQESDRFHHLLECARLTIPRGRGEKEDQNEEK